MKKEKERRMKWKVLESGVLEELEIGWKKRLEEEERLVRRGRALRRGRRLNCRGKLKKRRPV